MNSWGGDVIGIGDEVLFTCNDSIRKGKVSKITAKQCKITSSYTYIDYKGNSHTSSIEYTIRHPSHQILRLKEDGRY